MCGRFVWNPKRGAFVFELTASDTAPKVSPWAQGWLTQGHYNIAPTQSVVAAAMEDGVLRVD